MHRRQHDPDETYDESTNPSNGWRAPAPDRCPPPRPRPPRGFSVDQVVTVTIGGVGHRGVVRDLDRYGRGLGLLIEFASGTRHWMVPTDHTRIEPADPVEAARRRRHLALARARDEARRDAGLVRTREGRWE